MEDFSKFISRAEDNKDDYSQFIDTPEKQSEEYDDYVRKWIKSNYSGEQNIDTMEITPQMRERFQRYATATNKQLENQPEKTTGSGIGGFLQDLGISGARASLKLAELFGLAVSSNPAGPTPMAYELTNMAPVLQPKMSREIGYGIAGLDELSQEKGLPDGIPKKLAQAVGTLAVDLPAKYLNPIGLGIMAGEGVITGARRGISAEDYANQIASGGGGQLIQDTRSPEEQFKDVLEGGLASSKSAAELALLGGATKFLPTGISRPIAEGIGFGGLGALEGGNIDDIISQTIIGGAFGSRKMRAPRKTLADFKNRITEKLGRKPTPQEDLAITEAGVKEIEKQMTRDKGPTTISQAPKAPEPKVPEVKAKVAEPRVEFIEEKLPPKFEGKVSDAGIQPKSAEEGGAGKTVTSRAPEVLLTKNKEVKTYGQEGDEGFAKVNYGAEEILAKKNLQDGKWYDVTSGPAKEITDPVILENIRIAERGNVEKPISEVSTKETFGEQFKTEKFKTKDTKKPITSEDAQKQIDDYMDVLEKKYGIDAVMHAPVYAEAKDLPYGPSPISKPELNRLKELHKIRDTIDDGDLRTWRKVVVKDSGLPEKEIHDALNILGFESANNSMAVYFASDGIKNFSRDMPINLGKLYTHFAKEIDPVTKRHGEFRIGGTADKMRLEGRSYDSDLREVPWDREALSKTEKVYNAIAKTQSMSPINLSAMNNNRYIPLGNGKELGANVGETRIPPPATPPQAKTKPTEPALPVQTKDPHKYLVEQALREGKPVPPEVLKDYPDLAAPPPPPTGPGEAVAPKVKPTTGIIGRGLGKVTELKNSLPYKFKEAKKVYLDWVNKFQDVENLSKFAKDNGITLEKILDPQLAIRKKAGSVTTANSIIFDGTIRYGKNGEIIRTGEGLRPILENYDKASPIKDYKLRTDKLDKFLQANRTVTDLVDGRATPEQIRTAQARLGVMERSNPKEFAAMQDTAKRIYNYQKRVLNMLVESGMLSKESYDLITSKNKAYVPFERIMLEEQMAAGIGGKGGPAPRKVVFKMKGSEKDVKNTLESLLKKTYEIVDAVETNYVNRSIAQFSDVLPEFIQKIKQPMIPTKVTAGEIMRGNPNASGDINDVTIFRPRKSQLRNNEMLVYENGKASTYKLSDGLYQAVKTLDPKSSNMFLRFARGAKRVLQVGATATPEFALRNLMRDQTGAMINTKIKFKPFIDSISAISDIMGNKEIFKEYMASGGGMQSYADLNRNALAKTLNHLRGNRTVLEKMNVVTKLGDLSSLLETATRLGVYKAARRSGLKPIESGFVSAESTLDFRRSGSKGAKVNDVIAFFNAGLQGVDRMARAAKADPRSFTMKAIAAVTIPEMIFQVINSGDDEFKNSPRWRKDLFWHVPGVNVWIPKPFVVGQAFGSVPGRFMEYAITKDPHAFDGIVNTLLEAGSPVGMDAIGGLMPTALKPLMENAFNYNFFTQTNLYPEYKEKLLPGERHSKYTAETWKEIGGFLGVSPSKLENLYQGYTAGLGKYVTQGSDALIKSIRGDKEGSKPTELSDIPVVRGLVGRKAASHPEKLNQFYRAYEDIDKAYSQYKQYVNSDKMDKAEQYREDHPEIGFRSDFNSYRKKMSEIGKSIDEINKRNISDYEKRVYLKEWEEKRMELLDEILDKYSGKIKLLNLPKTITGLFQ